MRRRCRSRTSASGVRATAALSAGRCARALRWPASSAVRRAARIASAPASPPPREPCAHRDEPVAGAGMVVKPGKKSKTTIPESVQLHISAVRLSCSGALAPVSWRAA